MESTEKVYTEKTISLPKSAADLQRIKLEKLMKNPEKPVHIPDKSKAYKPPAPPEFVRNAWGSSAGAGSGDFHVYRGVRRREYARQKYLTEKTEKEQKDEEYQIKLEENKKAAEDKTAKKRAKRSKKKQKQKNKKQKKEENTEMKDSASEESDKDEKNGEDDAEETCFVIGGR